MNLLEALISVLLRKVMPPERMMEDVDECGEAVDEEESIQQIKNVRGEDSMCEICSRILKSAGALTRHKRKVHQCEEFMCQECGLVLETASELRIKNAG